VSLSTSKSWMRSVSSDLAAPTLHSTVPSWPVLSRTVQGGVIHISGL
jgi:hypothetical protein